MKTCRITHWPASHRMSMHNVNWETLLLNCLYTGKLVKMPAGIHGHPPASLGLTNQHINQSVIASCLTRKVLLSYPGYLPRKGALEASVVVGGHNQVIRTRR